MMAQLPEDDQLIDEVRRVTAIQQLKYTALTTVEGGILIGAAATTGALLLGPIGFVFGAVLSSGGCFLATQGTFKSVPEILMNLTEEEKHYLAEKIRNLLTVQNVTSVAQLVSSRNGVMVLVDLVQVFLKNVRNINVKA